MDADRELLQRWAEGDEGAGRELVDRYFDALHRFFEGKIRGGAEDLIQETFLACLESASRFRGEASLRSFIYAIARNLLQTHWRRQRRDQVLDFGVSSLADLGPSPSSFVRAAEVDQLLLQALRRLPLDLQIAVELRYFEELSGPELAEILEIPEGTVRSRLRRALEGLREEARAIAESPEGLTRTLSDLDDWAQAIAERREP